MKSCPTCKRTYSDETLSFCLADGSLLSAPYDPDATLQIRAPSVSNRTISPKGAWNGEFYANFRGDSRVWADAMEYGFLSGGGGSWFSRTLRLLSPGDRVWVNAPPHGFVGVGRVTNPVQPAKNFQTKTSDGEQKSVLDLKLRGTYSRDIDNPELCEYFVAVRWLDTVPIERAFREEGLFGNRNTVCKPSDPKWRKTIERLKQRFPNFDEDDQMSHGAH